MEINNPLDQFDPLRDRDAYATIRGFFFQAERTVQRWIQLETGQFLELECGEDIDIVSRALVGDDWQEERILEQLKSWEKNVTLVSGREALANFHEHRLTNPGQNLRFCLTTNAGVGVEKSPLFKDRKPGIEWWRSLATDNLNEVQATGVLARLRERLGVCLIPEKLNSTTWENFKTFVAEGDEDEWLDFIKRFEWATGTVGPLDLSIEIQRELLEAGVASDEASARAQYERLLVFVLRLLSQVGRKKLVSKEWKGIAKSELSGSDRELLNHLFVRQSEVEQRLSELEVRVEALSQEFQELRGNVATQLSTHEVRLTRTENNQAEFFATLRAGQEESQDQMETLISKINELKRTQTEEEMRTSPLFHFLQLEIQIGEARKLLESGRFRLGQERLTQLKEQVLVLSSGEERTRLESSVENSLAFCAWRLGDDSRADELFQRAYLLQRKDVRRIANAAFGKLLVNEPEKAITLGQTALALDPNHDDALSMVVRALHLLERNSEIEPLLERHPLAAVGLQTLFVRGGIAVETKDYAQAQKLAAEVVTLAPDHPLAHRLMGDAHFLPVQQQIIAETPILFRVTDVQRSELQKADAAFDKCLELMAWWESAQPQIEALVGKVGIREILLDTEAALAFCDQILSLEPESEVAFYMKGEILLHQRRDAQGAIACLSKIQQGPYENDARVLLAEAHIESKQWAEVITLLEPFYEPNSLNRGAMDEARLLLQAAFFGGDKSRVEQYQRDLETHYPTEAVALVTLSDLATWRGEKGRAIELMQRAFEYSSSGRRDRACFLLADAQAGNGKYSEAALTIEPLVDLKQPDTVLLTYLHYLRLDGQLAKAAEVAREVRAGGRAIPTISEHESYYASETGDYILARHLHEELSSDSPDNVSYARNAAAMWLSTTPNDHNKESWIERVEAAQKALKRIKFESIKDKPDVLMDLASLFLHAGLSPALEWAYRALRLSPGNGHIAAEYIKFVSHLPQDYPGMNAEIVQQECVVEMVGANALPSQTQIWIITQKPMGGSNEILPTAELAQKLLGKKVGDRLTLNSDSTLANQEYEIKSVRSKYVYALHDLMRLFQTGALSHHSLVVGHFSTPEEIAKTEREKLRSLIDAGKTISELYELYALPVAALAQLTGQTVPDFWRPNGGYNVESEGRFYASDGGETELLSHRRIATEANNLVLDWTALLSIVYLGIEGEMAQRFERLIVSDELAKEVFAYSQRFSVISHLRETPVEVKQREVASRLEKFVREKCEALSTADWKPEDMEFAKTYGRTTVATFKLASQEKLPLFSDDLRLRNLAKVRYMVEHSVGIQWLLLNLRSLKLLTAEAYFERVRQLIYAGYGYIWASVPFLTWVLQRNRYEVNDDTQAMLDALFYWKTEEALAVATAAGLLTALWKQNLLDHRRKALVKIVLNALVKGRDTARTIFMLLEQVNENLPLDHLLRIKVLQDVLWWTDEGVQIVKFSHIITPNTPLITQMSRYSP